MKIYLLSSKIYLLPYLNEFLHDQVPRGNKIGHGFVSGAWIFFFLNRRHGLK